MMGMWRVGEKGKGGEGDAEVYFGGIAGKI